MTYSWTGPDTFTSSEQSPLITNATTDMEGIYYLTVNDGYCDSDPAATDSVVVNDKPTATASATSPVCEGGDIQLTGGPSGMTYSWTGPDTFTSSEQSPLITNATTDMEGIYYLTVNDGYCDSDPAAPDSVVVNDKPTATASATSPVCEGGDIQLTGGPSGMTYSWTGPDTFTSSEQSPLITNATTDMEGIYYLTVNDGYCDSDPAATDSVVVNDKPTATASATSPVCEGGDIQLTGGPSGMTYSWTGPDTFTSSEQSPLITNATTDMEGIYYLTVNDGYCDSDPAATDSVVVNDKPTATASATSPVCEGGDIQLTGGPSGMTYSWTGPDGFTSTDQSPLITNATTANEGVYTLPVYDGSCYSDPADTDAVVVNDKPTASASATTPVCEDGDIQLTGGPDAMSYSWTGPDGFTSTDQSPLITNATTANEGVYTLTVYDGSCYSDPADTDAVVVNDKPTASASATTPVCEDGDIQLTGGPDAMSYSWTGPDGFTSTDQSPLITNATNDMEGAYTLTVYDGSCYSDPAATDAGVGNDKATASPSATTPVCEGGNIQLTGNPAGMTYSWTGPDGFTSTDQSPLITNATTANEGVYTLTVYDGSCYSDPADTDAVVVNDKPTASASATTPVCEDGDIQLTGGPDAMSYSWTGPDGFTSTDQSPLITNATTANEGVYTLTVYDGSCYSDPADTDAVVVNDKPTASASATTPVCEDGDIQLTGGPDAMSYSWTGPDTFTSSEQSPLITNATTDMEGIYYLTVNDGYCDSDPAATDSVVVNDKPTATASATSPVCEGGDIQLTGGPSGMTYSWTGPDTFTSSEQSPLITNATTDMEGIYYLTVNDGYCDSDPAATDSVVVNDKPTATASATTPVCEGGDIQLTGGPSGMTYSWTGPDTFTSSEQSPLITNAPTDMEGIYYLTVNDGYCDSDPAATDSVVVNDKPTATASATSPVCEGGDIQLTGGPSGMTYSWTGPDTFTSTDQSPLITNATTANEGVYTLPVYDGSCYSDPADTDAVVVNDKPTASASATTPVCEDGDIQLTGGPDAMSYSWTGPDGFTSTDPSPLFTTATTANEGVYTLTVYDGYCYSAPADTDAVVVNDKP